jgi:D-alanyl-D-alanine carboxypeptidase
MGAVLVARRDEVLLRTAYGHADADGRVPITPETRFPLASVTKPITATAVAVLASRGVVSLSDSVCEHLPGCPPSWRPIRIVNLLNHASGIPQLPAGRIEGLSLDAAVAILMNREPEFAAGSDYSYSNANYWLAGRIVELAADEPWAA